MPTPKHIVNDPTDAVSEFIKGLLYQFPESLVKLENHNVILDKKNTFPFSSDEKKKIKMLCGGGSGHEPSHAGWIGDGMLNGAILGGMFASPSVSSILAAICAAAATTTATREEEEKDEIFLIVKNYTGDRLNFGMACEMAQQRGISCEMVVIADDTALDRQKGITGARGVAGTIFVHKICGGAIAAGNISSLSSLKELAESICQNMGTLGIALDAVTVPGAKETNTRLQQTENDQTPIIEIGMGVHGEAGMRKSSLMTAQQMAEEMIRVIQAHGRTDGESIKPMFQKGDQLCVLVNNLGGASNFEMSILTHSIVSTLENDEQYGAKVSHVLVGSFMTSFNMHGASLTILNLTDLPPEVVSYLEAPTTAPAWTRVEVKKAVEKEEEEVPVPAIAMDNAAAKKASPLAPPPFQWDSTMATTLLKAACAALVEAEPLLTKYDTIVGDGDCGLTMKRGATYLLENLPDSTHPVTMFADMATAVSASMGGTSGVLLELFFRKQSSSCTTCSSLAQVFDTGVKAISFYGGATVGARTMLDALVPAAAKLLMADGGSLQEAATAAREGADSTAVMKTASAGRSNYLSQETLEGTPDPGAIAVAVVLEAMAKAATT